jgi:hypothetical protein
VMHWKWKAWEHSAVKMACLCPGFIAFKHIAHTPCKCKTRRKICEENITQSATVKDNWCTEWIKFYHEVSL